MTGQIVYLFVSIIVSAVTWHLYAILRASGLRERRMEGFNELCFVVPFWMMLSAIAAIAEPEIFRVVYILKAIPLNIVPYMSCRFLLYYSESKAAEYKAVRYISIIMPALALGLLLTNPLHNLYLTSFGNPPEIGPAFRIHLILSVGYMLTIYAILFRYIAKNFRANPLLLAGGIGTIIPIGIYLTYLFYTPVVVYDYTAIGYFFTIIFVAYASYFAKLRSAKPGKLGDTLVRVANASEIAEGDTEAVARLISKEACLALDAYAAGVWHYDENTQIAKNIICYYNKTVEYSLRDTADMHNIPQYNKLLSDGRIITLHDREFDGAPGVCSVADAPVHIDGKTAAIIRIEQNRSVLYPVKREWSAEEETFISSLADFMALTFINADRKSLIRRLETELKRSDEYLKTAFNSTPTGIITFTQDGRVIDCNDAIISMLDVSDEFFCNSYYLLSPMQQPDGSKSREKWAGIIDKMSTGGKQIFEWTYLRPDGTLLPCTITLVPVKLRGENAGLCYVHDLSYIKQVEKEKAEAAERNRLLLSAVNNAAVILLGTDTGSFEEALYESTSVIAGTAGADRMYIWKNHTIDGELYCSQIFEWSEGAEPQQGNVYTVNVNYSEAVPGLQGFLETGRCLNGIVREFPPQLQGHLLGQDIVSVIIVPIIISGRFWGFVGFDDCKNERVFSKQEETILRSAGLLLVNAYERNEMLEKIQQSSAALEADLNKANETNRKLSEKHGST